MPLTDEQLLVRMNEHMSPTSLLLGARLVQLDSKLGHVRMAFDAKQEFCNPMGNVQGGFVAAMLDEAASIAAFAHAQKRIGLPTLEFKVTFLSPARPGILYAEGRLLKFGNRTAFLEADLLDHEDRHLARMSATAMQIPMGTPTLVDRP
ncbi:PaaI family thioesterase [Bradyrhizobium sp. LA7.1]|uniref:PaaI family thioesterase n=1 Tax=Bradyrhizobium sp. LA7.1 TaxID=3156324 RepID=UPI00339A77A4